MAITISRTALNALVDDDGSNTTGSAWNKAAIGSVIMDPIDALLTGGGATAFTPGLQFGGAAVGMTFAVQTGLYWKFAQLVWFTLRIRLTAVGSSAGTAKITGMPFTVIATAEVGFQCFYCAFFTGMVNATGMAGYALLNTTTLQMTVPTSTATINMIESNFSNTSDFILTGSYLATT